MTSGGYVQKHDELRQVYGTLDLAPKTPDYAVLVQTASGCQIKQPLPMGEAAADGPVQCVDCAAPSLIGLTGTIGTWDMLAHQLTYLTVDGGLTKYKAVLTAVRCNEPGRALTLADELDEYTLDPKVCEPEDMAQAINCLQPLDSYEVRLDAGSYEVLALSYLRDNTTMPENALPYIDLTAVGQQYEDKHPRPVYRKLLCGVPEERPHTSLLSGRTSAGG